VGNVGKMLIQHQLWAAFPKNCQTNHPFWEPGNLTAGFKRRLTADQQRLSEINHDGKIHGDIRGDTTTYMFWAGLSENRGYPQNGCSTWENG